MRLSRPKAREIIESFLRDKGVEEWGDYGMEPQPADSGEEGVWAFWVTDEDGNSSDLTSYVHPDGRIESYGI